MPKWQIKYKNVKIILQESLAGRFTSIYYSIKNDQIKEDHYTDQRWEWSH